jgi:DNA-binding NtrC family response regulator
VNFTGQANPVNFGWLRIFDLFRHCSQSVMIAKTRVLIVDDEPIVGERLKASLERAGFSVDAFFSSQDALKRMQQESYDILVTDLKMKGPDGLDLLRAAKQKQPNINAIVITGFATRQVAEEARSAGAVHFIAKPFKISELTKLLKAFSKPRDSD